MSTAIKGNKTFSHRWHGPRISPRRVAVVPAAAIALAFSFGMAAPEAQAATLPACNARLGVDTSNANVFIWMPINRNSPDGIIGCLLGVGNSGTAVSLLQQTINDCYYIGQPHLTVDGIFGSQTQTALEDVQRHDGDTVDGVYGPQTANNMGFIHDPQGYTDDCYDLNFS